LKFHHKRKKKGEEEGRSIIRKKKDERRSRVVIEIKPGSLPEINMDEKGEGALVKKNRRKSIGGKATTPEGL